MEAMDWLDYVRTEKKKPFNEVKLHCRFPTDVIFKEGFDRAVMADMMSVDPTDETLPQFSSDPETILKQIVAYTLLLRRVATYKSELEHNYGILAPNLAEQLHKACLAQPTDQFSADKLVRNIRDYANAIAQREHKEEELMDSKLIEDEIKSLERNYD